MGYDIALANMSFSEAEKVTSSLASKGGDISSLNPANQFEWLIGMGKILCGWGDINDRTIWTECKILYAVWKIWDNLDISATKTWEGDFYRWAQSFSRHRAGKEPAKVTIDNKIGTFRDWEGECVINPPEHIFVPRRDEAGKLCDKDLKGVDAWQEVEFDPSQWDFGKKLIARATAKRGLLNEEAWTALADPGASTSDLIQAIRENVKTSGDSVNVKVDNGLDFTFFAQNDMLFVGVGGVVVAFARLISENADSPVARRAADYMLNLLGISPTAIADNMIDMELPLIQIDDTGCAIISKGIERIGRFNRDEMYQIYEALRGVLGEGGTNEN